MLGHERAEDEPADVFEYRRNFKREEHHPKEQRYLPIDNCYGDQKSPIEKMEESNPTG
jgi:hypothetical protein